jgi:hypothetical protein
MNGRLWEAPELQAQLNGPLIISENTDEKTAKLIREIGIEKWAGTAEFDLTMSLAIKQPEKMQLNGKLGLRQFRLETGCVCAYIDNPLASNDVGIVHAGYGNPWTRAPISRPTVALTIPPGGIVGFCLTHKAGPPIVGRQKKDLFSPHPSA